MALDLIEELEGLIARLEQAQVPYALCGGLAVAIHGHKRATMDIDLLVRAEDVQAARDVAKAAGFDIPARKMVFGLRTGTPREMHRVSKLDPTTNDLVSVDLIVVTPDYEEVWAGRFVRPWMGHSLSIVSREGLAKMKRLAGRPQDLADIAALEGLADDDQG
jgi:hypothetical protein